MASSRAKTKRKTTTASSDSGNGKSLVIVESPAKAKTINKYLGSDFVVKASMGHVRDLPEHDFGIDINQDFAPTYEISRSRVKTVAELKKLAKKAPNIYLATDRDREGEAIAWHLVEALDVPPDRVRRVIFNEITKSAIREAFEHPHDVDMDRVNAQQARRILDRIVGYELSPLLWQKIAKGLSAGRVQSVAVRLIVEREREIRAFAPEESWKIAAAVTGDVDAPAKLRDAWAALLADEPSQKDVTRWLSERGAFRVELAEVSGEPFKPNNAEAARKVVEALGYRVDEVVATDWDDYKHLDLKQTRITGAFPLESAPTLRVSELATKRTTTRPAAPFTTASLQQAASTRLGFGASRTMRVAQALYEGIDLHGEGPVGLITYMRTDSTNLAGEAIAGSRSFIQREYGVQYVPEKPNFYGKRQERAQEAHEAVRPTEPSRTPASVKDALTNEQFRLYELIWKRFIACQMKPAEWDSTSISLTCDTDLGAARFAGNGRKLVFDGFMRVAGVTSDDQILPPLVEGDPVGVLDLEPKQHWTSPPARFTEATLVRTLESEGIGRPSTYASIIDVIQQRGYVELEERKFFPTSLGEIVNDKLVAHFPKIMDVKFTSYMEDELDKVEDDHLDWIHVLHEFYDPFRDLLSRASSEMEPERAQPSEYECPACGAEMVYRWSRSGRFLSCSKYPECKQTLPVGRDGAPRMPKGADRACEKCGKSMIVRESRFGHFLGCSGYPECENTLPCDAEGNVLEQVEEDELKQECTECGQGTLIVKWKRGRPFMGCDRYPKCKHTTAVPEGVAVKKKPAPPPEEAKVACEKCGRPMVIRTGARGKFIACSGFPKCRSTKKIELLEELQKKQAESGEKVPSLEEVKAQEASAKTSSKGARGGRKSVDLEALGDPPPGFAWTRTGRPVVEVLPDEGTLKCPECRSTMELKRGRFGPFFSCTGFPKCKFNANLRGQAKKDAEELLPAPNRPKPVPTDIPCEECGEMMLIREGRGGKFLGCSAYPKCRATQELPPGYVAPEAEASASSQ